eukprot:SAG11_NODE_326_length_10708_cov_6.937035_8_plen_129_part_00
MIRSHHLRQNITAPLHHCTTAPLHHCTVKATHFVICSHHLRQNITLRGLTLAHSADTFLEPYVVPSPGDWSISRNGALFVNGAEDLSVESCTFVRLGGNGTMLPPVLFCFTFLSGLSKTFAARCLPVW